VRVRRAGSAARHISSLLLVCTLSALPGEAQAQPTRPHIGYLSPGVASTLIAARNRDAFQGGLRELNYNEGANLLIDWRFAEGKNERLPALAAELVNLKVDVIVAVTNVAANAARAATSSIPIIFVYVIDPVATQLVSNLARPGRNLTGFAWSEREVISKLPELLRIAVPKVTRVGVLYMQNRLGDVSPLDASARTLGLELVRARIAGPSELESAFNDLKRARVGALVVPPDPVLLGYVSIISKLAINNRLPSIYWDSLAVEEGALMSYGVGNAEHLRRAASYVDRILRGAKPENMPVEINSKFELVVNARTAKTIGLTMPQELLLRADRVIE
jgi:putative tryptophan/tyrosine transport system substrate-binding protein